MYAGGSNRSSDSGFLRSETSLIQTMGRAARNVDARVVMYADTMTTQMQAAIDETERRRIKQAAYNVEHGITPETIRKSIRRGIEHELKARKTAREALSTKRVAEKEYEVDELITMLEKEMLEAAERLEFEQAAALRDRVAELKSMPTYGTVTVAERGDRSPPRAKPGEARSRAGITAKGAKRGGT